MKNPSAMLALVASAPPTPSARTAKKKRESARLTQALVVAPDLRLDRLEPVLDVLRAYRRGHIDGAAPLEALVRDVDLEVRLLEATTARRDKSEHRAGPTIRRALTLLKTFGRLSALDFDDVPIEARPALVKLLALEYRWCFAAAGTTPRAFKIAIGRTGAR